MSLDMSPNLLKKALTTAAFLYVWKMVLYNERKVENLDIGIIMCSVVRSSKVATSM